MPGEHYSEICFAAELTNLTVIPGDFEGEVSIKNCENI